MYSNLKEAILYTPLPANVIRCEACSHQCNILPAKTEPKFSNLKLLKKENIGFCGSRINIEGKLFTLTYGRITSLAVDATEKKPLFHFLPGSNMLSFGSFGCNLRCPNCHNWEISQTASLIHNKPDVIDVILDNFSLISPAEIINQAVEYNCPAIAYTYNEPTISIEFVLDVMKLAKKAKIKNVWVTNGIFSAATWKTISPYLDAINVDLKSFDQRFYHSHCKSRLSPVLENLRRANEEGIHLEITTLIIPGLTNKEQNLRGMAAFIKNQLSPDVPWHVIDFSAPISWQMQEWRSLDSEELKIPYRIGKEEGLHFVYAPFDKLSNTYCPNCKILNIARKGYNITRYDNDGYCQRCGQNLFIK